ncbi:MAG: MFS transporter [Acidobacteria bacterium]|nr:MFS transporter [Acidobacteriota bacterium]
MSGGSQRIFYGWWIVAGAFVVIFVGFGAFYTFPVFYPEFMRQFGWSRTQISVSGALALLVTGLVSPFVGGLADRRGTRFTMIAGTIAVALAMIAMSQMQRLYQLYAIALVFGLGLAGFSIAISQMLVARWFIKRRGLATGLVISGMGLGGTVGPLVVTPLLTQHGWRAAFVWEAAFLLLISLPLAVWVLRERPSDLGLTPDGHPPHPPAPAAERQRIDAQTIGLSFPEAGRTAAFWFLSLSTFCAMFASLSVIQHLVLYMRGLEFELASASRTLSALLLASVVGRVGLGHLSDRLMRRHTLLLSYGLLTVGALLLLVVQSQRGLLAMAVLVGLGYGGSIVLLTLSAAELFGTQALGKILGVMLIFFTAGGSLGPVTVGYLADRFNDYGTVFIVVAVAAIAAVVIGLGVRPLGAVKKSRTVVQSAPHS